MKMKIKPYPAELKFYEKITTPDRVTEEFMEIDGWNRSWKQYIPSSFTGKEPIPMVISMHGGDEHNAEYRTGWALIAEREGFVALFPQCIENGETWNTWNTYKREDGKPNELIYLDTLIEHMVQKYNIDRERIYMHGQSMGDSMTTWYTFERGELFAAAAPFSGHTPPSRFVGEDGSIVTKPHCPLPVIRTHGSEDMNLIIGKNNIPTKDASKRASKSPALTDFDPATITEAMRIQQIELFHLMQTKVWTECNGCRKLPMLSLRGRYAAYCFHGEPCDFIYYTVNGGFHGTYIDMADYIWSYFFTNFRRVNGKIVRTQPNKTFVPDRGAVALAEGADKAYVNNELAEMPGGVAHIVEGVAYAPALWMEKLFPGVHVDMLYDGQGAEFTFGSKAVQVAMNNRVVVCNETLVDINRTLVLDGQLYVPVGDLAGLLMGKKACAGYSAGYVNDCGGEMSFDLAYVIRRILGVQKESTPLDCLHQEQKLSRD